MLMQNETFTTDLRRYKITQQFIHHAVIVLDISHREVASAMCMFRTGQRS